MATDKQVLRMLVSLKDRIVKGPFGYSEWKDLGALTGFLERIEDHPRLLRSLSFGDEDYDGHVLTMLHRMIDADIEHLNIVQSYVDSKCPDESGVNVSSKDIAGPRIYFTPSVFSIPETEATVDRKLVSVMMPFDAGMAPVYESIQAAAVGAGLTSERADNVWEHSVVIQDIFSLIYRSFIVVCDFSGKNPNVFYEAGIAHTLGKHVIPITQSADDIPFDLKHHRYLKYLNNREGRKAMQGELAKRLETLVQPLRPSKESPPPPSALDDIPF